MEKARGAIDFALTGTRLARAKTQRAADMTTCRRRYESFKGEEVRSFAWMELYERSVVLIGGSRSYGLGGLSQTFRARREFCVASSARDAHRTSPSCGLVANYLWPPYLLTQS